MTRIRSIAEAQRAAFAGIPVTPMPTTASNMGRGQITVIPSTNARKPARFVRLPVKNTQTMWTQTVTESATTAAQQFR